MGHIEWSDDFLRNYVTWPVQDPQVQRTVASYHKKHRDITPTAGFLYSAADIVRMAEAIADSSDPRVRHPLRVELLKVLGLMRTDDSLWCPVSSIKVDLRNRVITGISGKTKGLERMTEDGTLGSNPTPHARQLAEGFKAFADASPKAMDWLEDIAGNYRKAFTDTETVERIYAS